MSLLPARERPDRGRRLALLLGLPTLACALLLAAVFGALGADQDEGARALAALQQAGHARDLHLAALRHREALRDLLAGRADQGDLDSASAWLERAAGLGEDGPADGSVRPGIAISGAAERGITAAREAAQDRGPRGAVLARFEDLYAREVLAPLEDAARTGADSARGALGAAQDLSRRRLQLGAGAALLSLLLAVAPALLLARQLSRGIGALGAAARRIGEGELSARVGGGAVGGELACLGEAIDHMAARLEASRDHERLIATAEARIAVLEETRSELEARVAERTRALSRSNADLAENLHRLAEAQQRLLLADRLGAIGQLAAAVAHEVNNPVASVVANLGFLAEEVRTLAGELRSAGTPLAPDREGDLASAFADAREATQRVSGIVKNLETIARGDADEIGRVDLREAMEAALGLASAAVRHQARVERRLGDVPPVLSSTSCLGQVFLPVLLLAGKSIAARPPGSGVGIIRVDTWTDPEGLAIAEIADDGAGLAPEAIAHLFDPFGSMHPESRAAGPGLAVAHGIVTSLGGTIDVRSEMGAGTTFRIALPPAPRPSRAPIPPSPDGDWPSAATA